MKQIAHKIATFFLAFIVLFSTFSFKVESHFCGDNLIDTSIFSKVKGCSMEMLHISKTEFKQFKKSCCRNETIAIEGNTLDQHVVKKIKASQVYFVKAFITSYISFIKEVYIPSFDEYLQPLVKKNRLVLFENFRI